MHVEKIYYQRNFQIGAYMFESIGIGITVNEGEDAEQALNEAKRLAIEYNEKNNPHLQSAPQQEPEVLPVQQVEKSLGSDLEELISKAKDWETLKSFAFISRTKRTLIDAFDNRKKELGVIG